MATAKPKLSHETIDAIAPNEKQVTISVLSINVETETLLKPDLEAKISANYRLSNIDMFKGVIMILMVLDHSWGIISPRTDPEWWFGQDKTVYTIYGTIDIALGHCAFFMIRFVTKMCAPGFFMMLGFGMVYFYQHRYMKVYWKHRYLIIRLLIRSLIIISIGFLFDFIYYLFYGPQFSIGIDVLVSLGINMMIMTPFVSMEFRLYYEHREYKKSFIVYLIILLISMLSTLTEINNNITKESDTQGTHHAFATMLYFGYKALNDTFYIYWPIVPWLQFTCIGCLLARFMIHSSNNRKKDVYKKLFIVSIIMLLIFVLVRRIDGFGNFGHKWNGNNSQTPWTVMNFFNVTFTSPSLSTVCLYTGINVFVICFIRLCGWRDDVIRIFGNTSLFFYVVHLVILVVFDKVWSVIDLKYNKRSWIAFSMTFVLWICVVLAMYPLCMLYHRYKMSKLYTSIWRMF
eukprot:303283_1